jgi:TPR repeat protein
MKKLIFLIFIIYNSMALANQNLQAYKALENKEYDKALFYLSYQANLGDDRAQYNLGIMYKKGLGVPANYNEAFGWFFLSADQGNILANYALGNAYLKGEGINKNYLLAFKSYKYAGLRGHPMARLNIGNMYFNGLGIKRNYPKAYLWWRFAQDQNANGASENIEMLEKKMNNSEKYKGIDLYKNCMKDSLYNCTKE